MVTEAAKMTAKDATDGILQSHLCSVTKPDSLASCDGQQNITKRSYRVKEQMIRMTDAVLHPCQCYNRK